MSANLEQMAVKIKAQHDQVVQTARKSLDHAKKAGELLAKAKAQVEASTYKWSKWVEQECGILERTASNYIRIHNNWAEIERKLAEENADFAGLTVRAALSLLKTTTRKTATKKAEEKAPAAKLTLSSIQEKMSRYHIQGDPKELVALLKELGVEVAVEVQTAAAVA